MANEAIQNIFGDAPQGMTAQSVTAAMVATRQAQEVQAMVVCAHHFPRDQRTAYARIMEACARPTLAEDATYEYSKGGTKISGPSIRLAECIAQNWGNIDFGFTELERKKGESVVRAYAWDLETNTRQSRDFSVRHQRDTRDGSYAIKDEREIYELIANQAARRVRNCILSLIPGDVIDAAVRQCEVTLKAQAQGIPIEKRREDMVAAFAAYDITPEMLAAFCQKQSMSYLDEVDLKRLRKAYTSLRDGVVGSDYFTSRMQSLAAENASKSQQTAQMDKPAQASIPDAPPPGDQMGLDDL